MKKTIFLWTDEDSKGWVSHEYENLNELEPLLKERNIKIGAGAKLGSDIRIGNNVEIGYNVSISTLSKIHDGTKIENHVSVGYFTKIERNCIIGHSATIGSHCFVEARTEIGKECKIKDNVKIRSHCDIRHRTEIGSNVTVPQYTQLPESIKIPDDFIIRSLIIRDNIVKHPLNYWGDDKIQIGYISKSISEWETDFLNFFKFEEDVQKDYDLYMERIQLIKMYHQSI